MMAVAVVLLIGACGGDNDGSESGGSDSAQVDPTESDDTEPADTGGDETGAADGADEVGDSTEVVAGDDGDEHADEADGDEHADEAAPEGPVQRFSIRGQAEMVTGGDVLVEFVADGVSPDDVAFTANGENVDTTSRGDGLYLVSGLDLGESVIEPASVEDESVEGLAVVNHPIQGPVFSGPHQSPIFCTFEDFGLEPAADADADNNTNCDAEAKVEWGTINDEGDFEAFEGDIAPDDIDPNDPDTLIIRREQGTINRGIYQVVVADPSLGAEPIELGKHLIYRFGGGCGTGFTQGRGLGSNILDEESLAAGFIIATSTFNTFQTHCNDVLSAETLMMVQEHVDETLGPIGLTIGRGGSGGAIQQYLIAQNYPGLLDALNPSVSFPDAASISGGVTDCGLLVAYWETEAGADFDDDARTAISGHGTPQFCFAWVTTFVGNVSPSASCSDTVPEELIYNAQDNADGLRCTLQDSGANIFGLDENGFGRRALDNVGVEYGRRALEDGLITVDQFLTLNRDIGGYDIDGNIGAERTAADPEVIETAYATGRVLRGDSAVAEIPIIDVDRYSDLAFDIHDRFRLFSIRARLLGVDGNDPAELAQATDNRVIWTRPGRGLIAAVSNTEEEPEVEAVSGTELVQSLVEWVQTNERPDGVADDCVIDSDRTVGDDVFAPGETCAEAYPYFGDPRTAAGAPLRNDILKCALVPADAESYGVEFTDEQGAELEEVFADGVCDYTQPGIGQVPLAGTWLDYTNGPLDLG